MNHDVHQKVKASHLNGLPTYMCGNRRCDKFSKTPKAPNDSTGCANKR